MSQAVAAPFESVRDQAVIADRCTFHVK
jgi:hypothetical protein